MLLFTAQKIHKTVKQYTIVVRSLLQFGENAQARMRYNSSAGVLQYSIDSGSTWQTLGSGSGSALYIFKGPLELLDGIVSLSYALLYTTLDQRYLQEITKLQVLSALSISAEGASNKFYNQQGNFVLIHSGTYTFRTPLYVSLSNLVYINEDELLSDYALKADLNDYVLTSVLTSTLSNYALKTDLNDYVLTSVLTSTLSDYVLTSVLTSTLSNYALKTELPVVPPNVSAFNNDAGYITIAALSEYALSKDIPTSTSDLTNDSGYITSADIPAAPTKTSELQNDSGFITGVTEDMVETALGASEEGSATKYFNEQGNFVEISGGETTLSPAVITFTSADLTDGALSISYDRFVADSNTPVEVALIDNNGVVRTADSAVTMYWTDTGLHIDLSDCEVTGTWKVCYGIVTGTSANYLMTQEVTSTSTNTEVPTAKAVYEALSPIITDVGVAQSTADEAATTASSARNAAIAANATANEARTNVILANNRADEAKTAAATAQSTADEAVTNAATAQSTANSALNNARAASRAAGAAQAAAETAQSTADSKLTAPAAAGTVGQVLTLDSDATTPIWKDPSGGNGRNLFDIFYSMSSKTPPGAMDLSLGTLISSADTAFPNFYNECVSRASAGTIPTCTETDWQSEVITYGSCVKFVVNTTDKSIRLPKITNYLRAGSDSELGTVLNDQFQGHRHYGRSVLYNSGARVAGGNFHLQPAYVAETDGTIEGDSGVPRVGSETRPKTSYAKLYIQVYNSATEASMAQASEFINSLEAIYTKIAGQFSETTTSAGTTGTGANDTVVEYWKSSDGTMWYRLWASGWLEQGYVFQGYAYNNANRYLSFNREFADTNYICSGACADEETTKRYTKSVYFGEKTTTSVAVVTGVNGNTALSQLTNLYFAGWAAE